MRCAGHPGILSHPGDRQRSADAADVANIRLHNVYGLHADHTPELHEVAILLATRDRDAQGLGDFCGAF
jgi:hypothetical protein